MPAERVSMRHAREIIRLKFSASLPTREIARRLGLAPSTVRETLTRVESAGLSCRFRRGSATPDWRRRFTPIAEANGDTAATPNRIGSRSIGS